MRKWLWLATGLALEAALFACSGGDMDNAPPMIGDCTQNCGGPAGGGASSGSPDAQIEIDAADGSPGADATFEADGPGIVDVGVQGNDVFGDTTATVDVGVSDGSGVFPFR